ncbi:hypothetical protein DF186_25200, partial [Enterococcus hirae]
RGRYGAASAIALACGRAGAADHGSGPDRPVADGRAAGRTPRRRRRDLHARGGAGLLPGFP